MSDVRESVRSSLDQPTLRSLTVEANDGIIATAGVVEGFVAAGWSGATLILAALCSMIAGGVALGGGRYAEEAAERDAHQVLIAEESEQLARSPQEEFDELTAYYEAKGLYHDLAMEVAAQLTANNALAAHLEAEHSLSLDEPEHRPVVIGVAAGAAYALGSLIPLTAMLLVPDSARPVVTIVATVIGLVLTSWFLARIGVRSVSATLRRALAVSVLATGLSMAAGFLVQA